MSASIARALVTGISGQDGSLLAAGLLESGVEVVGTRRPPGADEPAWRHRELGIAAHPGLRIVPLDPATADVAACVRVLDAARPDAVFHLAGQSRVAESFDDPLGTIAANGLATAHWLEALRKTRSDAHFVLAASAEMFAASDAALDESAPLAAATPYALSKQLAHGAVGAWRAAWGLRASSAIAFNHESEWRDETFVTRRISRGVARIALGLDQALALGNLDARRDFGYAPDFVAAFARIGARAECGDWVLASGTATSIREFATQAFAAAGIALEWRGSGIGEVALEAGTQVARVRVDPRLLRPVDAALRVGDASRARRELGFANTLDAAAIARRMVEADLARERRFLDQG
jgi:GDPmannose 4,6-dehydratase